MKDTCCDAAVIARRMKLLEGTPMLLLNANGQTLLDSLRAGAHGYCGVMCNFHPELFVWLCHNFEKDPARADLVQSFLGCAAFLESLAYPVIAKYHLKEIEGLPLESISARTRDERECTEYHRACIRQMDLLARHIKTLI
jgi:4-hydroxy-tetrahydrodipicolinate synthase